MNTETTDHEASHDDDRTLADARERLAEARSELAGALDDDDREILSQQVARAEAEVTRLAPETCPWTDADECAMAAERSVAGTSDTVPGCAEHERPVTRTYTLTVTVGAPSAEGLPPAEGLVSGIEDGLPDEWFDSEDGDAFYIVSMGVRP